jgi:hypothetical protein
MWNWFSDIYVLNQAERTDRWELCKQELARVGINDFSQFLSIPADPPMLSFCISQHEMLKTFLREGGVRLLDLEDDVIFNEHLWGLETAISQLPEDWDFFYLGCNLQGQSPGKFSSNLSIPRAAWMSHAIGYSRRYAEFIVKHYDPKSQMYDDWLGGQLSLYRPPKAFVVNPMCAGQRPGKSDLWGAWTDYTQTIIQGNELL